MKVSYLFYFGIDDAESVKDICKRNKIPKAVIEGFDKIIIPLFNLNDKDKVKKYLELINSKFKNNVDGFIKSKNYPGEQFFIKITIDCSRNQISEIKLSDEEGSRRRINIIVDFGNADAMYNFLYKNVYDKFFPGGVLKEAKESLMKCLERTITENQIDLKTVSDDKTNDKKAKGGFLKVLSLIKKDKNKKLFNNSLESNLKNVMKKHFTDMQMKFSSYNFSVSY